MPVQWYTVTAGFLAGLIPQIQEAGAQASKNRAVAADRRQESLPQLHKTARGLCIQRGVCRDKDREQGLCTQTGRVC